MTGWLCESKKKKNIPNQLKIKASKLLYHKNPHFHYTHTHKRERDAKLSITDPNDNFVLERVRQLVTSKKNIIISVQLPN